MAIRRSFLLVVLAAAGLAAAWGWIVFIRAAAAGEAGKPGAWRHYFYENRYFSPLVDGSSLWTTTDASVVKWDLDTMRHVSYTRTDGFPDDYSHAIALDPGGGVWFASSNQLGLLKNGKWTYLTEADGLASAAVSGMVFDSDGHIWVAYGIAGAGFFDGTTWHNYTTADGLADNRAKDLVIDSQGDVWLATYSGLNRFDGSAWHTYTTTHGLLENFSFRLAVDQDEHVWAVHSTGVSEFDGAAWKTYTQYLSGVFSVFVDSANVKWFGAGGGAVRFDGSSWSIVSPPGGWPGRVFEVIETPAGCHMFLTEVGIYRRCASTWAVFTIDSPIPSNNMPSAVIDAQGNRWFGGDAGLVMFDGKRWQTIPQSDVSGTVMDLALDPQGRVWAGTFSGAYVYSDTQWVRTAASDGLPRDAVRALAFDQQGGEWFGTDAGAAVRRDGTWQVYTITHRLGGYIINDLAVDWQGNVWAATYGGASRFDGTGWQTYTTTHGMLDPYIYSLAIGPDGRVWAGSSAGVNVFDGQVWTTYGYADGLEGGYVHVIVFDDHGDPWVGSNHGVFYFDGVSWQNFIPYGSIHYGSTWDLAFDAAGHLWVANPGAGIFEYIPGAQQATITPLGGTFAPDSGAASARALAGVQVSLAFGAGDVTEALDLMYIPRSNTLLEDFPGIVTSFELYGLVGGTSAPQVAQTGGDYLLTIQYDDAVPLRWLEETLRLQRWNGSGWIEEPTQQVDLASNRITAAPLALTHFVLSGEPNPAGRFLYLPVAGR